MSCRDSTDVTVCFDKPFGLFFLSNKTKNVRIPTDF